MLKKERAFYIKKNLLDNKYNKLLSYMESEIIIAATAIISVGIYFYSIGAIPNLAKLVLLGGFFVFLRYLQYSRKLRRIDSLIFNLK